LNHQNSKKLKDIKKLVILVFAVMIDDISCE